MFILLYAFISDYVQCAVACYNLAPMLQDVATMRLRYCNN